MDHPVRTLRFKGELQRSIGRLECVMTIDLPMRPDQKGSTTQAKFHGMPRLQSGRIGKPRLSGRFQRPTALTVVRAPHRFGKSMLVAQW